MPSFTADTAKPSFSAGMVGEASAAAETAATTATGETERPGVLVTLDRLILYPGVALICWNIASKDKKPMVLPLK